MNLMRRKEGQKTGRQIRIEIIEALSAHDILSTQQIALHVDSTSSGITNQLIWLHVHETIERVMYVDDDYAHGGQAFYWNVYWSMTNHGRHHLKKFFEDCRGCRVREMEDEARGRVTLRARVMSELHGSG